MPDPAPTAGPARGRDTKTNLDREIYGPGADMLGWAARATQLAHYLLFRVETPITLGIQGDWGSGKSSFINLVEAGLGILQDLPSGVDADSLAAQLRQYHAPADPGYRVPTVHAYVLRFDSWAFAQSPRPADELFPIYVARVLEAYLQAHKRLPAGRAIADRFARVLKTGLRVGALGVMGAVAGETANQALAGALAGSSAEDLVDDLSSFKADFQRLVQALLANPADAPDAHRLIIIVDDLDRIAPQTAVEITEKLKVFLDVRGVIFILAADLSIIQVGLRQKFRTGDMVGDGRNYLDKIVKLQYNVPQLQATDLAYLALRYPTFARAFGLDLRGINWEDRTSEPLRSRRAQLMDHDAFRLLQVFPAIAGNIRNSKRVLLNFEFSAYLLGQTGDADVAFRLLAVTVLHQYRHALAQGFYSWLARPDHPPTTPLDTQQQEALAQAVVPEADAPVSAFFDLVLARQYTIADWLAAYTAALNPLSDPTS